MTTYEDTHSPYSLCCPVDQEVTTIRQSIYEPKRKAEPEVMLNPVVQVGWVLACGHEVSCDTHELRITTSPEGLWAWFDERSTSWPDPFPPSHARLTPTSEYI